MKREILIDPYTYLSYKKGFDSDDGRNTGSWVAPTWVGDHWRRLMAYKLYESYYRNNGRAWHQNLTDEDRSHRREYGDAGTIVDQVLSSLLGDDQSLVIPEASGDNPDPAAEEQLALLLQWAEDERFDHKMIEAERSAIKLGDAVYVLGWNEEKQRPVLRVWDPGFYFPVLDAMEDEEFPRTIHIAYEYEVPTPGDKGAAKTYIRRITWELVDTAEDERFDATVEYNHAWNENATTMTVVYSDGSWLRDNLKGDFSDLDPSKATWRSRDVDLEVDFIPVIHVPNLVAESEHYGTSLLARPLQIIDDLINNDTDLQASSATTGSPPIAVSGVGLPRDRDGKITSYGPGTVWETGDGNATMIDTSRSLDALLKYDDHLLERLAVVSKVPESLLGRVKPNEVPSGIAITLSFTPHASLVKEMRLVRKAKYRLLLKFVTRFYMANDDLVEDFGAQLVFGSFLPADRQETTTVVQSLLNSDPPAISQETAVRMLMEAGFPIEDAVLEVRRIRENDFKAAGELLDASGDIQAARQRLGLPSLPPELLENPDVPPEPEQL